VVGVSVDGKRDVLGLWIGDGGEGAKYWHQVPSELRNRGVADVCFVVCDGLRGLPESVSDVWPLAIVQTCVLHLVRNSFRYASKADWYELARDLRPCGCRKLRFEWSALADSVEEPPRTKPHRLHRKLDGVFVSAQTRAGVTS
jgi:transposase-like protein